MDKCEKKARKLQNSCSHQVVVGAQKITDLEVTDMTMTEAEEDIICRMHKLVGDNWELIAGRIPGRKAEEIKRFWLKNNSSNNNNNNRDRLSN